MPKQPLIDAATWIDDDGLHALLPGTPPDPQMMEELTRRYQEHIRRTRMAEQLPARVSRGTALTVELR